MRRSLVQTDDRHRPNSITQKRQKRIVQGQNDMRTPLLGEKGIPVEMDGIAQSLAQIDKQGFAGNLFRAAPDRLPVRLSIPALGYLLHPLQSGPAAAKIFLQQIKQRLVDARSHL